jgi:hypothetical protein
MDRMQRGYFRQAAKNTYLELKRQDFQSWIGRILALSYLGDYENIRLTQGDGGLDGIILSRAAVVAVNAPREQTASTLAAKIKGDFTSAKKTLRDRGVDLKTFIFVHNDEGLTKDIGPLLMKLRQDNSGLDIECWSFERIWNELAKLEIVQLEEFFGPGPTVENVEQLQMPVIREVIDYLTKFGQGAHPLVDLEIPDPQKLEYNQLAIENQDLLRAGRSKHRMVEQYLAGITNPEAGNDIAEGFRLKYAAVKESGATPDDIFHVLWNFAGGNHFTTPPQVAAVTAILSFFFHSCDIFENVPVAS